MNAYFSQFIDLNMCNGFNKELKPAEFVNTLDEWIWFKDGVLGDAEFKQHLNITINEMLDQYFKNQKTYEIKFADMHDKIKLQLMGDGSPHGIRTAQTKKQYYMQ